MLFGCSTDGNISLEEALYAAENSTEGAIKAVESGNLSGVSTEGQVGTDVSDCL